MSIIHDLKNNEVGFLVYAPLKNKMSKARSRYSRVYFDKYLNAGMKVVTEILEKNGITVVPASLEVASKYRIVLVSFTSTFDMVSYYKKVALLKEWQPENREFKIIAGGFGMQNPYPVRNYVDYAVFGRAENFVYEMVDTILGGGEYSHPSVMRLPDVYQIVVSQPTELLQLDSFRESFTGCYHKCKFCHYSWTRKHIGEQGKYQRGGAFEDSTSSISSGSIEVMMRDIKTIDKKQGKVRVALDGSSERLRFLYGKRITNEKFIEAIEHVGSFGGTTFLHLYNIVNMPTETEEDREEFLSTVLKAKPEGKILLIPTQTPFRATLSTPLLFSPINLFPDWSKHSLEVIFDVGNIRMTNAVFEHPFSILFEMVVIRANEDSQKLFHTLCFSGKLNSQVMSRRLMMLQKNFDLSPYLREYDVDEEKYPGWWLQSYASHETMKKAYLWTKKRENKKWKNRKFV